MSRNSQITLVRHGETEWTERGLLHGRLDSPLNDVGRRHAQLTARRLSGEGYDVLYSSPRGRALETASVIGRAVDLIPSPLDGFQEMDYGWLEGRPLSLADPSGDGAFLFRPLVYLSMALTAERPAKFANRVARAAKLLQDQHPGERVLVVTHWGVLSMLMALVMNGNRRSWRDYGPWAACGISELHVVDGVWRTVKLNDSEHLEKG